MAKIFTFADRAIPVQFFDTDPINVTLIASDEMDRKILEADKLIQADTHGDLDARKSNYRAAVDLILRSDITEQILSRSDYADSYALINLYQAVVTAYGEGKRKNLGAPR